MQKTGCTTVMWCLLCMLAFALLFAGSPATGAQASQKTETMEAEMNLAHQFESGTPTIPPIDARAPAAVETASFGLG